MTTSYVVTSNHQPDSIFSREADAQSFADRQNALDKARHPHRQMVWTVHAVPLDPGVETPKF